MPGSPEKKTGNKINKILLFLATKIAITGRHATSLLVDITHYWLFKSLMVDISHYWLFKFLAVRQISSRSLVNVNCKYVSEEICPVLVKTAIHKM